MLFDPYNIYYFEIVISVQNSKVRKTINILYKLDRSKMHFSIQSPVLLAMAIEKAGDVALSSNTYEQYICVHVVSIIACIS